MIFMIRSNVTIQPSVFATAFAHCINAPLNCFFQNLAPFCHPIRSKTKANLGSPVLVVLRFASTTWRGEERNLISPYSLILIFRLFLPLPLFFFFLPNNYFYTAFNTYMNVLNDTHRGSLWFWPPLKWVTSPFCWNVVSFDSDTHWRWVKHMAKRVCRNCPIPKCGAKYLVKLSNHLTDVHRLDYQISIEGSG